MVVSSCRPSRSATVGQPIWPSSLQYTYPGSKKPVPAASCPKGGHSVPDAKDVTLPCLDGDVAIGGIYRVYRLRPENSTQRKCQASHPHFFANVAGNGQVNLCLMFAEIGNNQKAFAFLIAKECMDERQFFARNQMMRGQICIFSLGDGRMA